MKIKTLLPVIFGFFIMGFCDVVGIASTYVKQDFNLSDTAANFLPSMLFIWFFVFSVPVGVMMNRLGRKKTVLISMILTAVAMLIPVISYTYVSTLIAFAILGIGNTIIQVALNPLLTNIVKADKLTSALTTGQFIKAISSFCGPIIAGVAATTLGNWQLMFPIFAVITLISLIWLWMTQIPTEKNVDNKVSLGATYKLFGKADILLMFLGILAVVGVDVGMNVMTPRILMERCGMDLADAGYGTSLYFFFRTAGAFLGAFILAKFSSKRFFKISSFITLAALIAMLFAQSQIVVFLLVAVIGLSAANIFAIIFGIALENHPDKANEVSGLMVMGISGGAIIPPLMGMASEAMGGQNGSVVVVAVCAVYLLICALFANKFKRV